METVESSASFDTAWASVVENLYPHAAT